MKSMIDGKVVTLSAEEAADFVALWEDEPASAPPYRIYKSKFIERMTEQELTTLTEILAGENIKYREMYAACDYFVSDDPLFAVLHFTVVQALGLARADQLLEPNG